MGEEEKSKSRGHLREVTIMMENRNRKRSQRQQKSVKKSHELVYDKPAL